jgi:hypothetical protein
MKTAPRTLQCFLHLRVNDVWIVRLDEVVLHIQQHHALHRRQVGFSGIRNYRQALPKPVAADALQERDTAALSELHFTEQKIEDHPFAHPLPRLVRPRDNKAFVISTGEYALHCTACDVVIVEEENIGHGGRRL